MTDNCRRINVVSLFKIPWLVYIPQKWEREKKKETILHNESGGHYNCHSQNRSFDLRFGRLHLTRSLSMLLAV